MNQFCFGFKSKLFASIFDLLHAVLRLFFPSRFKEPSLKQIQRILLCNWANLGDVVLATSVIAALKAQFPGCRIGFLVSKQSSVVLQTSLGIDWVHETYSWARVGTTVLQKVRDFFAYRKKEEKRIVQELTEKNYDVALELFPFFPNTIALAYKAKIPVRIGFNTSGNHLLLTRPVSWKEEGYLPLQYGLLLERLGVQEEYRKNLKPSIFVKKMVVDEPFVIFHLCSSFAAKEFPLPFWQKLYGLFREAAIKVVFTGRGEREKKAIESVCLDETGNLCDRLSWNELVSLIQRSALVVSVDSVPIHLAAALDVSFIGLYNGNTPHPGIWQPIRENGAIFFEGIDPSAIFEKATEQLMHLQKA